MLPWPDEKVCEVEHRDWVHHRSWKKRTRMYQGTMLNLATSSGHGRVHVDGRHEGEWQCCHQEQAELLILIQSELQPGPVRIFNFNALRSIAWEIRRWGQKTAQPPKETSYYLTHDCTSKKKAERTCTLPEAAVRICLVLSTLVFT